jgi:hypothetical protein
MKPGIRIARLKYFFRGICCMSTLDALLLQLKQTLAAKADGGGGVATMVRPEETVDSKAHSAALREFISKATAMTATAKSTPDDDPQVIAVRRSALSSFVGTPLTSTPQPYVPLPITPSAKPHGHGHGHGGNGHGKPAEAAPAPTPVQQAPAPAPAAPCKCATMTAPAPAPAPMPAPVAAPAASTPVNAANFAWSKHIQTVEAALRMGDVHFAESVLALLQDISLALSADLAIRARLKSQMARVRMERKQFAEVEADLLEMVKQLNGTPHTKSMGAAYCLLALAQCYNYQKKEDKAQSAQRNAIVIAEAVLGASDPEAKCFRMPLAS